MRQDFVNKRARNPTNSELVAQRRRALVFPSGHIILCKPAIVEEVLADQVIEDVLRNRFELRGEFFTQLRNRIIARPQEFYRM